MTTYDEKVSVGNTNLTMIGNSGNIIISRPNVPDIKVDWNKLEIVNYDYTTAEKWTQFASLNKTITKKTTPYYDRFNILFTDKFDINKQLLITVDLYTKEDTVKTNETFTMPVGSIKFSFELKNWVVNANQYVVFGARLYGVTAPSGSDKTLKFKNFSLISPDTDDGKKVQVKISTIKDSVDLNWILPMGETLYDPLFIFDNEIKSSSTLVYIFIGIGFIALCVIIYLAIKRYKLSQIPQISQVSQI